MFPPLRFALAIAIATGAASARITPTTGRDLLDTMRAAYPGGWFTTLTFTQQTTKRAADGTETVATWYESLRYTDAKGAELAPTGVDLARPLVNGRWHDRAVWIAGASSAADSTSPQFWVDVENKMVVRAIFVPVPGAPVMDMRFERIVPVAGGLLATRCEFYVAGQLVQVEEYAGWKGNVPLAGGLFDPASWSTAPHWAAKPSLIWRRYPRRESNPQGREAGGF